MVDFSKAVKDKINSLTKRLDKNIMLIALISAIDHDTYDSAIIINTYAIVEKCVQCGNYRRACYYIMLANKLLDDIEKNEKSYTDQLTSYILS